MENKIETWWSETPPYATETYFGVLGSLHRTDIEIGFGGGFIDTRKGGGTVWLSENHTEALGVRFAHEAVGATHPTYHDNATRVNKLFNTRFERDHHGSHFKKIGFKTTGLYESHKQWLLRKQHAERLRQKPRHY